VSVSSAAAAGADARTGDQPLYTPTPNLSTTIVYVFFVD